LKEIGDFIMNTGGVIENKKGEKTGEKENKESAEYHKPGDFDLSAHYIV